MPMRRHFSNDEDTSIALDRPILTNIQPSMSTSKGSWGFDVNRSTNGQPLSTFLSNNTNSDHRVMLRTRDNEGEEEDEDEQEQDEDYDHRHLSETSSPPSSFKLPTPTLTRHRDGNEFAAVDRLVHGPNGFTFKELSPLNNSPSTRPTSARRSRSIEELNMPPSSRPNANLKTELIAWQSRMIQRDQRTHPGPPSTQRNELPPSNRQLVASIRPESVVSNMTESQHVEHDHHEPMVKSARVIKRYIELLYHLQAFYQRITDQLFDGSILLRNNLSSSSIFINHCRKITDQIQGAKPIWERKLGDLQNVLKDMSTFEQSNSTTETTFLQRRSTLLHVIRMLNRQKDLDTTHRSILNDVDRILYEEKLAIQLQDELSTLLQHQSMLNDFTSLLQWNCPIYAPNDRTRAEALLPFLREQMTTTDSYISHVSQQLIELVNSLRSLEKYILSYTTTIPLLDDGKVPPTNNHDGWRPYAGTDVPAVRSRVSPPPQSNRNDHAQHTRDQPMKMRSISMSRFGHPEQSTRPWISSIKDQNDSSIPPKRSLKDSSSSHPHHDNLPSTRVATIRPARRDQTVKPNGILKHHSTRPTSVERISNLDLDTIGAEIFNLEEVRHLDRFDESPNMGRRIRKDEERQKMPAKQSPQEFQELNRNTGIVHSPHRDRRHEKQREPNVNVHERRRYGESPVKHYGRNVYRQPSPSYHNS